MSDVASPSTGTAGWVTNAACFVVLCIVDVFQMPFSRWGTCWRIFRCSSALVWGGCTDTGYFWSPGMSENLFGHQVCFLATLVALHLTPVSRVGKKWEPRNPVPGPFLAKFGK